MAKKQDKAFDNLRERARKHRDTSSGKLTATVLAAICENYAAGNTVDDACAAVGVSSVAFHKYRIKHPEFDQGPWQDAVTLNTEHLESLAHKLAVTSDHKMCTMLIFMLKARKPSVYRENHNFTGKVEVGFPASFAEAMTRVTADVSQPVAH